MAVNFTSGAGLRITTGLPSQYPMTWAMWAKVNADVGGFVQYIWNRGGTTIETLLGYDPTSTNRWCTQANNTIYRGTDSADYGVWHHLALSIVDGSTARVLYLDGVHFGNFLAIGTDPAAGSVSFNLAFDPTDSTNNFLGAIFNVRAWTAALTQREILFESQNFVPVRTANLWGSWPLLTASDVTDTSGNARDWTVVGSPTTLAEGPPQRGTPGR